MIHDIEGFTGLTAKPLACGIQPAYNGMASAVISVFPQHLYRALHFPLDKWALHNGRFFCLPEQAFLHPGPTPRSVGFAGPGGAFGIGPVSVCLDREVVKLAGILWYIKPQQFRHLFIVLLPDGVDNDVPVLRQILP